ncbi:MAG: GIY-YIG nuclease family protein [Verrucomicrobiales bacterium]
MPIIVYAIRFQGGEIYIGMTNDLERRLQEHSRRQSPSTKKFKGSFILIHEKVCLDYSQARRHEKYLKSGAGRTLLKNITT